MPDFTDRLPPADLEKLKAFIQGTADTIRASLAPAPKALPTTKPAEPKK